jgi:hypothetical protein
VTKANPELEAIPAASIDRVRPGKTQGMLLRSMLFDDVQDRLAATEARSGNVVWAIDALGSGQEIGPHLREFLVANLRGEIKNPKGNKRTFANMSRDLALLVNVVLIMCERQVTENAAIMILVEADAISKKRHPLQIETARSMVKRAKENAPDIRAINLNGKLVAPWSADAPLTPTVGEKLTDLLIKPSPK